MMMDHSHSHGSNAFDANKNNNVDMRIIAAFIQESDDVDDDW